MRQQSGLTRRSRAARPVVAPDVHAYVLARLEAHLAELQHLRSELLRSRPSEPGARWHTAAATATGARRYAADIALMLNSCAAATPNPVRSVARAPATAESQPGRPA
jgi:hypothetical protein